MSIKSINAPTISDRISIYREILNSLPAAVYMCDADGYVTAYNEAAVNLWGRQPEIGKDLWCGSWKIYDLEGTQIPLAACPMALTLKTGKPVIGKEVIIEQPDGTRYNVLPHPQPIFNDMGKLAGAINMLVDITGQKRFRTLEARTEELAKMARSLQESEERYHLMVSEVEDYAIVLLSPDGIIQNWNRGAEKIKGYKEQEIVGRSFTTFYTEEDQRSGLPGMLLSHAANHGKANHEGWRVRKDGTRFWGGISITALHNQSGKTIGFVKVTRDLTERRSQEELLRQSEERYHRMVAEVEDYVIILLDSSGHIQNWNKGAEKIKGYMAEEVLGKHFSIFYPEADQTRGLPADILRQAAREGKAVHEGWRQRKDGSLFWGSVVMTAIHNDDGKLIGFTKVTRDLTERKLTEERLLESSMALEQKNRELERINEELSSFAYISSHDLQEPLRKIQTFADRIQETEYANLSEKGRDYFKRMQAGASRMQKLIRDILTYSRTTTAEKTLELTDLNDLLSQAKAEFEVMIHDKQAIIENDRLPVLKVIPFQMQQLFNNLLNNALKFSKPGEPPHIIIRSEIVDGGIFNQVFPPVAKEYYHLSFRDHGIGFEPEYSKKIFEVFQRLHGRSEYGGTGIGLAICKKIVENHYGFISAESYPGKGSTFHVYLPVIV